MRYSCTSVFAFDSVGADIELLRYLYIRCWLYEYVGNESLINCKSMKFKFLFRLTKDVYGDIYVDTDIQAMYKVQYPYLSRNFSFGTRFNFRGGIFITSPSSLSELRDSWVFLNY